MIVKEVNMSPPLKVRNNKMPQLFREYQISIIYGSLS